MFFLNIVWFYFVCCTYYLLWVFYGRCRLMIKKKVNNQPTAWLVYLKYYLILIHLDGHLNFDRTTRATENFCTVLYIKCSSLTLEKDDMEFIFSSIVILITYTESLIHMVKLQLGCQLPWLLSALTGQCGITNQPIIWRYTN